MKKYITPPSLTTGFSAKGRVAKKRFANILDTRIKRGGIIAAVMTAMLVFICGGSSAGSRLISGKKPVNLVITGRDSDGRNDAVLVCELSGEALKVTQLPRDTWILDEAAGHKLADISSDSVDDIFDAVFETTGVQCEKYVSVNYEGFRNIVDSMGGVDFDVPVDMEYTDEYQNLHISLKAGRQHLDGSGVEQLMRYRKSDPDPEGIITGYENGDLGRLEVHGRLYEAIAEKLLSGGAGDQLIKAVKNNVSSDLTYEDMAAVARRAAALDKNNIDIGIAEGKTETYENRVFYVTDVTAGAGDIYKAYD